MARFSAACALSVAAFANLVVVASLGGKKTRAIVFSIADRLELWLVFALIVLIANWAVTQRVSDALLASTDSAKPKVCIWHMLGSLVLAVLSCIVAGWK